MKSTLYLEKEGYLTDTINTGKGMNLSMTKHKKCYETTAVA